MNSVGQILLILVKGCALLLGIMMLIGGGLCSISIPFFSVEDTLLITGMVVGIIALLGLLVFLAVTIDFIKQIKVLLLLSAGLFLVGGGLCVTDPSTDAKTMSGLLFIDIAVMLTGYILIRWILTKKHRHPEL
jgi:hypothetical protein